MHLPKQLLPFRRKNLLQHTIDEATASKADSVCVVLGAHAKQIQKSIRMEKAQPVVNPDWIGGMSTSIRTGIAALPASCDAAIISLSDQPMISSAVFDGLINMFRSSGKSIVACRYAGETGVPVLFAKRFFPELSSLEGDSGAKKIVQSHHDQAAFIEFPDGDVDLDTPDDYKDFIERGFKL